MSDYSLQIPVVSPELLMETVNTLASSPRDLSINDIESIIDKETDYAESLVHLGSQLGLIKKQNGNYVAERSIKMQVRQSSDRQRKILLNNLLQQYDPFVKFASSLIQGDNAERASVQVKVVYQLGVESENIEEQFKRLAEYSGLFSRNGEDLSAEFNTSVTTDEFIEDLSKAVNKPLVARLFLENRFGDELVAYIDEDTFEELVNALELFWERPRSSIAAAGRAVEDFLREVGDDYGQSGTNYSSSNGIGQLIDDLQGDSLIKKRHFHGGNYLAGIRNPSGGHGKDPDELERWEVSPEVAFGYTLSSIHFIRSLYAHVEQGRLVL